MHNCSIWVIRGVRYDLYGPYSPDLADEAKEVLEEKKDEYEASIKEQNFRLPKKTSLE